ncbi:PilW family protein [Vibrio cionasavignyae]|uniref:PilW family protein n=1 Tax=Vibrio cionasavignyae TaxID=2910252 RepID=UPI003D0F05FE
MSIPRQKGGSLVEMLVASTIGIVAIGSIGSVYLMVQQHSSERAQTMLLSQALATTARRLQNDLTRAGYSELGSASRPSGAVSTVHVSGGGSKVQYVYWDDHRDGSAEYENTSWHYSTLSQTLRICRKRSSVILDINYFNSSSCTSLLEDDLISVTHFSLVPFTISSSNANKQYMHLSLAAELTGNTVVTAEIERHFLIRNGQ